MSNEKKYFEFLDIPDGNGGTERWHAKDAEAIRSSNVFTDSANGLAPAASSGNKTTAETSVGNYYLCADGKYRQLPSTAFSGATYESKQAASGGTDVSLCTTGEKYTWNNKQASVAKLGSTTKPVYTSAAGTFAECSTYAGGTAVTLNGTSKASSTASFYAPTDAGTSGQFLQSNGSGAPSWATVTIPSKMSDIANLSVVAVTADTASSCAITGSGNAGKSQTIIYTNTASGAVDRTISIPSGVLCPDGTTDGSATITCPAGGYCEVNYLNIGGTVFARFI